MDLAEVARAAITAYTKATLYASRWDGRRDGVAPMSTKTPEPAEIVEIAKAHDGRYLLPRRFGKPSTPLSETDLAYAACEELVRDGLAEWLPASWSAAPGIRLTSKAYLVEAYLREVG